jgi:hypothetical protein
MSMFVLDNRCIMLRSESRFRELHAAGKVGQKKKLSLKGLGRTCEDFIVLSPSLSLSPEQSK